MSMIDQIALQQVNKRVLFVFVTQQENTQNILIFQFRSFIRI